MTTHLSPQESVNALDGVLPQGRQAHLDSCASCQTELEGLRATMAGVRQVGDVPEPSPLFWTHFEARVQAAVQDEMSQPARVSWWSMVTSMRGAMAAAATVAIVAIAVSLYPRDHVVPVEDAEDVVVAVDAGSAAGDDGVALETAEWVFVSGMMDAFEAEDVREVLAPSRRGVDAAFEVLTSEERDAFVKLLKAEMAEGME